MAEVMDRSPSGQERAVLPALPVRLHHHAYVVADQERTRAFYEDILGLPLVQFWIEDTNAQGQHIVLSHAFYGLADGSALAFFCMATPELHEQFKSPQTSTFNHLALKVDKPTQDELLARIEGSGYQNFSVEHGYCRSIYVRDPDGLLMEFTLDDPRADEITAEQLSTAHDTLKRWSSGDRTSNNHWR